MPSVSDKQHRFMEAAAHDAGFAKRANIPQSVAKEFAAADEGKKRAGTNKMKSTSKRTAIGSRPR